MVTTLLRPLASEMFSTDMYDRNEDKSTWLSAGDLTSRGERPVVGPHVVPQRQLNQVPDKEINEVRIFPSPFAATRRHIRRLGFC